MEHCWDRRQRGNYRTRCQSRLKIFFVFCAELEGNDGFEEKMEINLTIFKDDYVDL